MGLLNGSIDSTQSGHVANLSTSKEIWDTLHQINVKDQQSLNVYALVEEIWSMNWDGVTPMPDHIRRMIDIHRRIIEGKGTMDDMCHKLHLAITPRILARFPWSKMRRKALKKTFRTMPKTCQSDQYSSRYQLISAGH